jgi:3-oxoacyl-[acyl-carrier-protein] synthase-3
MMFKQTSKKTKIPMDKIPETIDRFGNTSGASIPLTLCDIYGNDETEGASKELMCGFGIGLSWGVVYTEIQKTDIFPIIYTDDYFKDGGVSHD